MGARKAVYRRSSGFRRRTHVPRPVERGIQRRLVLGAEGARAEAGRTGLCDLKQVP